MPANKPKQDSREATKGNKAAEEDSFEMTYLQNKYLVSRQKVMEAMKACGNDHHRAEAYLIKYTTRGVLL
jgi:hypothetical protein